MNWDVYKKVSAISYAIEGLASRRLPKNWKIDLDPFVPISIREKRTSWEEREKAIIEALREIGHEIVRQQINWKGWDYWFVNYETNVHRWCLGCVQSVLGDRKYIEYVEELKKILKDHGVSEAWEYFTAQFKGCGLHIDRLLFAVTYCLLAKEFEKKNLKATDSEEA